MRGALAKCRLPAYNEKKGGMALKTVILSGSPHPGGASETLAKEKFPAGELIRIYDKNILPCRGCGACEKSGVCPQRDDFAAVLRALDGADDIVLCYPVYFDSFPAPMKAFIDRLHARYRATYAKGNEVPKRGGRGHVVLTCGADYEPPVPERTLRHIFNLFGLERGETYLKKGTDL